MARMGAGRGPRRLREALRAWYATGGNVIICERDGLAFIARLSRRRRRPFELGLRCCSRVGILTHREPLVHGAD